MRIVKKKKTIVSAWQLGANSEQERILRDAGQIIRKQNGEYELFSQECHNGTGQLAHVGDYFKVDSSSYPYPIKREIFEETHIALGNDLYEQITLPLQAWFPAERDIDDGGEIIAFLVANKGLKFYPEDTAHFLEAPLWGTIETAGEDAAVIIYNTFYDKNGNIEDVEFNFVARDEFNKTYEIQD